MNSPSISVAFPVMHVNWNPPRPGANAGSFPPLTTNNKIPSSNSFTGDAESSFRKSKLKSSQSQHLMGSSNKTRETSSEEREGDDEEDEAFVDSFKARIARERGHQQQGKQQQIHQKRFLKLLQEDALGPEVHVQQGKNKHG